MLSSSRKIGCKTRSPYVKHEYPPKIQVVTEKPTLESPCGSYKWCPSDGSYGGFWYVGHIWTGDKMCVPACDDGVPL